MLQEVGAGVESHVSGISTDISILGSIVLNHLAHCGFADTAVALATDLALPVPHTTHSITARKRMYVCMYECTST